MGEPWGGGTLGVGGTLGEGQPWGRKGNPGGGEPWVVEGATPGKGQPWGPGFLHSSTKNLTLTPQEAY